MVYWIAFSGHLITRRWFYTRRYDTRILKGPLDKLIGRDNYQIFKAGTHPLLGEIKKEFHEKHSLHGAILEIYDVKHLIFLKTSLENFDKFTRHRFANILACVPQIYEVEPETILRSEKLIVARAKKNLKRNTTQGALASIAKFINATRKNKVNEDFPTYVNNLITEYKELSSETNTAAKRLSKQIKKLDEEIEQLHKDLMELWKKQRVDL